MQKGIDYIGSAVGAFILNEKGELFLMKRGVQCRNEVGYWEAPGGSIHFNETMEDAIKREIKEELGIEIEIMQQFPAVDHFIPTEKQHWVATAFLATFKHGQTPRIMEPDKCDEIGWFALDSLPTPLSSVTQINIDRDHIQKHGNIV